MAINKGNIKEIKKRKDNSLLGKTANKNIWVTNISK